MKNQVFCPWKNRVLDLRLRQYAELGRGHSWRASARGLATSAGHREADDTRTNEERLACALGLAEQFHDIEDELTGLLGTHSEDDATTSDDDDNDDVAALLLPGPWPASGPSPRSS